MGCSDPKRYPTTENERAAEVSLGGPFEHGVWSTRQASRGLPGGPSELGPKVPVLSRVSLEPRHMATRSGANPERRPYDVRAQGLVTAALAACLAICGVRVTSLAPNWPDEFAWPMLDTDNSAAASCQTLFRRENFEIANQKLISEMACGSRITDLLPRSRVSRDVPARSRPPDGARGALHRPRSRCPRRARSSRDHRGNLARSR